MSRFGVTVYGTDVYGPDPTRTVFDAGPFRAVCYDYGKVRITWRKATGNWNALRLLRSANGPAMDEFDGTLIYSHDGQDAATQAYDSGLTRKSWYYYTLLLFDVDTQSWIVAGADEVLIIAPYGMTDRQYELLPSVAKSPDLQGIGNSFEDIDTPLYRFLSVIGEQWDTLRTAADALGSVNMPGAVPYSFLPAVAGQLGLPQEPELGARAQRRFIANAAHLYHGKGTAQAVAELSDILTGWYTGAAVGRNMALSPMHAGPTGTIGFWGLQAVNAAVSYRSNDDTIAGPVGDGTIAVRVLGTPTSVTVGAHDPAAPPSELKLYGIPITDGQTYVASIYMRTATATATGSLSLEWLDRDGASLGTVNGPTSPLADDFTGRPAVTGIAPLGASFVLVSFSAAAAFASNDEVYAAGFQFEVGNAATTWQCPRELVISMQADLVNHVVDPSGASGTPQWSALDTGGVASHTDTSARLAYLVYTAGTAPGMVSTPSRTLVQPGQPWTVLADVSDPTARADGAQLTAQIGVRTYANSVLVDTVLGPAEPFGTDWRPLSFEWAAPFDQSISAIEPVIVFGVQDGSTMTGDAHVRHAALEQVHADAAFFFDGSTPSRTGDYLWEGTPGASASHFYRKRATRAARLRAILADWLPIGACYDLVFAQPTLGTYASSAAIESRATHS